MKIKMTEQKINNTSPSLFETRAVWDILSSVNDPEIPVLSIVDLGIVRDVKFHEEMLEVIITPTYSGCPAMDFISVNIKQALSENDFEKPS